MMENEPRAWPQSRRWLLGGQSGADARVGRARLATNRLRRLWRNPPPFRRITLRGTGWCQYRFANPPYGLLNEKQDSACNADVGASPMATDAKPRRLRSQLWFDNPDNPGMTALYLERYLNFGLTREELTCGKPIVGIAQSGSDLSPCNRHHIELAKRVREGIRDAGGGAPEVPSPPLQKTGKRPT